MKKYLSGLLVSGLLLLLFLKLSFHFSDRFAETEQRYASGEAANLAAGLPEEDLRDVLLAHRYFTREDDAGFAAREIVRRLDAGQRLQSLYDLNKRSWQIPARTVDSLGSPGFRDRLRDSRISLGMDDLFREAARQELPAETVLNPQHSSRIRVTVKDSEAPAGILVRLSEHFLDSLDQNAASRSTLAFLRTDSLGQVTFGGLDPERSYSVLPIREGYEYGTSRGTVGGTLAETAPKGELRCTFTEQEHRIRLFDLPTLRQIKEDGTLTVRSPEEFRTVSSTWLLLFFAAWWGILLWNNARKRYMDRGIWAILMLMTGLCLLTMYSLNDPLRDKMLGIDMAQGILAGTLLIGLLQHADFVRLYRDRSAVAFDLPVEAAKWFFKPFRRKVSYLTGLLADRRAGFLRKLGALACILLCLPLLLLDALRITRLSDSVSALAERLPKGSGYLLAALLLTALLFTPLGVAVGGMRVNLNVGILFQPSEIAKYLIVLFTAAYFSRNADRIVKYSQAGNNRLFGAKLRMLGSIAAGLGLLLCLYLVLGDMGPALVLTVNFILLYSVIKSKIDLENLDENRRLARILTCDLAMLVYGVLSFLLFLYLGHRTGHLPMFCIAWFAGWIILGVIRKQVFESALFFNLVLSAFIFGSSLLSRIPPLQSVAERLESRNEMCTNTWGTLPLGGSAADPGENTQVVEGLWGLASGGLLGQGLGNGQPHFIPAFHTDMILESIGEQTGFIGILLILILYSLLFRRTVVTGYRTSHPFAFYLCLGIAAITAVQLLVIALGSTGVIPLTGVTVPFFSYGKVSMILNLLAFGLVLSVSSHNIPDGKRERTAAETLQHRNIGKYNYAVSLLSGVYCLLLLLVCGIFLQYQLFRRSETLIRPVYVNNASGIPIVEYNPRIARLVRLMDAGNIYDRNGILLATSDHDRLAPYSPVYRRLGLTDDALLRQQRFYPFGEHLYFMLGDFNSRLFFSADDRWPRGYMAEARHLTELRGYDNVLRDVSGNPVRINLSSDEFSPGRYHSARYTIRQTGLQLRDYSALLPYLKAGEVYRRESRRNVGDIEPQDVRLTLDASLQTRLQQELRKYASAPEFSGKAWNRMRISVVVLDARQGDLLASANYPLPDLERLRETPENYTDNGRESTWKAYTERDLGLTRTTPPGSTAKVISSLAGLRKLGIAAADPHDPRYAYYVDPAEKVGIEPTGTVTMRDAIVQSSNCYYINLVNDCELYPELAYIYRNVGVELQGEMPYCLDYGRAWSDSSWTDRIAEAAPEAVRAYRKYRAGEEKERMYHHPAWLWTWGQGGLWATPLAIARATAIVANEGRMPVTRYAMNEKSEQIPVVSAAEARALNRFMKEEAQAKGFAQTYIGGKTGTAERPLTDSRGKTRTVNDGWFVCFIENARIPENTNGSPSYRQAPLAVAVRMERLGSGMSGQAVQLTRKSVLKILRECGYLPM